VTVMAGSDEQPADPVADVLLLRDHGLSPSGALQAASSGARRYLGLPTIESGAPADLLLFARDPREGLATLREPVAVMSGAR
jgi:imidazolonepropionase-like amidohydrolase